MRILCCVCYFLTLFYGAELLVGDEPPKSEPANYVMTKDRQKPLKETIEDTTICVYYNTYTKCTDLYSKEVTYYSIES